MCVKAALIAGFGFISLAQLDISDSPIALRYLITMFGSVSLGASLLCVCHATYVTIWV